MQDTPKFMACAAAGLACQNVILSFFLVFCAACFLNSKTKLFLQCAIVTCFGSFLSQLVVKLQYVSAPLGICAFIIPILTRKELEEPVIIQSFIQQPPKQKQHVSTYNTVQRRTSPGVSLANLL